MSLRASSRLAGLCALVAGCGAAPAVSTLPAPRHAAPDDAAPRAEPALHVAAADALPDEVHVDAAPPRPARQVREIELDGFDALEVVLGDADFDDPLPTVWSFHGRGDRPRPPGVPFEGMDQPFRVVLPRGPLPLGGEHSWLPVRVAEGRTQELTLALLARAEELARAIRRHAERAPYVGRAIVTGFSQGGVVSFALAVLRPDLVGFALPNAGWLPPALVPASASDGARVPPIRSTHGVEDTIVAYGPTLAVVERLRALGVDAVLEGFEGVPHEMSEAMNARFHEWLAEALARARTEVASSLSDEPSAPDPEP